MNAQTLNLSRLLRPYVMLLVLAFAAMLVQGGTNLLEPWPLKVIFDYVIGLKQPPAWLSAWTLTGHDRLMLLYGAAVAVIAIAVLGAIGAYANKYLSTTVAKRVGHDLRRMLYHHVQRMSLSFYERRQTGDMVIRLTSDIEAAEEFISSALLGIALDVLTIAGMLCVMFLLDWRFSLIGLSVAPLLFAIVFSFTRRIKKAARAAKNQESQLASVVQESMSSARVIKAFAREDLEEERLAHESQEAVNLTLHARSIKARLPSLVDIVVASGTCLVLWFGVRLVLDSRLSPGALLVFVLYLDKMYKPMKDLSKMADGLAKAAVALDRVGEIMSMENQVGDLPGARPAPPLKGQIEFRRVRFAYTSDQPILDGVSLTIDPGQCAALVGLTGAGKSTLLALIARLYDVLDGEIRIDGVDIRRYTVQSLRQQVSFVLQESVLFRASIASNIAYGKPDATGEEILRAAKLANVDEFARRMPHGYETIIGERGETLSGGQRQRIAIARAIVRDAPILLLDEPSASLDSESERLIFDGLARLMRGRTSIVIAHRLTTVRHANIVLVLNHGRIAERGTHEELLRRDGLYSQLYRVQFPMHHSRASLRTIAGSTETGVAGTSG